jgi:hypothetical protein
VWSNQLVGVEVVEALSSSAHNAARGCGLYVALDGWAVNSQDLQVRPVRPPPGRATFYVGLSFVHLQETYFACARPGTSMERSVGGLRRPPAAPSTSRRLRRSYCIVPEANRDRPPRLCKPEVTGSIPVRSTSEIAGDLCRRRRAKRGSASPVPTAVPTDW